MKITRELTTKEILDECSESISKELEKLDIIDDNKSFLESVSNLLYVTVNIAQEIDSFMKVARKMSTLKDSIEISVKCEKPTQHIDEEINRFRSTQEEINKVYEYYKDTILDKAGELVQRCGQDSETITNIITKLIELPVEATKKVHKIFMESVERYDNMKNSKEEKLNNTSTQSGNASNVKGFTITEYTVCRNYNNFDIIYTSLEDYEGIESSGLRNYILGTNRIEIYEDIEKVIASKLGDKKLEILLENDVCVVTVNRKATDVKKMITYDYIDLKSEVPRYIPVKNEDTIKILQSKVIQVLNSMYLLIDGRKGTIPVLVQPVIGDKLIKSVQLKLKTDKLTKEELKSLLMDGENEKSAILKQAIKDIGCNNIDIMIKNGIIFLTDKQFELALKVIDEAINIHVQSTGIEEKVKKPLLWD